MEGLLIHEYKQFYQVFKDLTNCQAANLLGLVLLIPGVDLYFVSFRGLFLDLLSDLQIDQLCSVVPFSYPFRISSCRHV